MGDFLHDFWLYLKERKKYWIIPCVVALLALGALIVIGQSAAISPFVYTLF